MNAITSIRESVAWSNQFLDDTVGDMTVEQMHWKPAGVAHPVSALYAHAVIVEDLTVNAVLKAGAPLLASTFVEKTGISEIQITMSPEWAGTVTLDLSVFRVYKQAVYQASDEYIASLTEADLDPTRDMTNFGLGVRSIGWLLNMLVAGHLNNLTGEISAVKGMQGLKGYPF